MAGIFGDETIPVNDESPEDSGLDESTTVDTESEDMDESEIDESEESEQLESEDPEDTDPDEGLSDDEPAADNQPDKTIQQRFIDSQRKITEQAEELKRLRAQTGQGQPQGAPQEGQPDLRDIFWERMKEDPIAAIQAVARLTVEAQTAPILEERRTAAITQNLEAVAKEYKQINTDEGFTQLFSKVEEIAQEMGNPGLVQNPTTRILRMAAAEAFGDTKAQAFQKGKQAGRTESEQTRQSKQGLGASKGARPLPAGEKSEADSIKESILAAGQGGGLFG